jgi:subtilisin family serine protease
MGSDPLLKGHVCYSELLMRKFIFRTLMIALLLPLPFSERSVHLTAARDMPSSGEGKLDPGLRAKLDALQADQMMKVIVTLVEQADLSNIPGASRAARLEGVIRALQATARNTQRPIQALLASYQAQGRVGQVLPFWVFNGISVTASQAVINDLVARPDVLKITPDMIDIVPVALQALNPPEQNIANVNAPALWALGYLGQGVVVANLDTGVDLYHPELASRWRGGGNSWYDPYGQHSQPADFNGHGTWTMGVMVGGDAGGSSLGVAPQAQWIAAKIFNDSGTATATAIHLGFQWLLDPDGDPSTADAPQVVNNSWVFGSPGCNLEFQPDLQALRAANILPVFSAGNFGPGSSTSASPANYPEALAVGGVDNNDQLYTFSSRGPSSCGESQTTYPDLVAPGVDVKTTDLFGLYTTATGTSLAAPHAAGGLALLLNAFPNLSAFQQETALLSGAVDLGTAGADNDFGSGRLDILAAYQWLQAGGGAATPSPTPTPTSTPTPTAEPVTNLALNKTVTVSSYQDGAHAGPMAVDGSLATYWQTERATGRNKLPSESFVVDLGSSYSIGKAVLEWDAYYAMSYSLSVSEDHATWTTVFSTGSGDGANDTLFFNTVQARYVKMDSTAWNSGSLRNWLREFQVFASDGSLPTPSPTASPTFTPTSTPPAGSESLHIGDLDGSSVQVNRKNWGATLILMVQDAGENPISSATVSGIWSGGYSGSASCTTNPSGMCQVDSGNIKTDFASVNYTVKSITHPSGSYDASANHDPDGDSDGTSITIFKP